MARAPQRKAAINRAREVLEMSGQSAKERHAEKRNLVMRWIYEFGYIDPIVTAEILGVKSGKNFLAQLEKKGGVRLIVPRAKMHPDCPSVVAVLTEFGIVQVERELTNPDDLLNYPLTNPINQNKLAHDTLVQRIAVKVLSDFAQNANVPVGRAISVMFHRRRLFTDRRLTADPLPETTKIPDLYLKAYRTVNDMPVDLYIELELTAKKEQALYRTFVKPYDELLQDKGYEDDTQNNKWVTTEYAPDMWLFTDSRAAGAKYQQCMSNGSKYPLYQYNKKTRGWKFQTDHKNETVMVEFTGGDNITHHDLFTFLDAA